MHTVKRPEVVVVTGASAGVGRATVRAFAQRGAHLGLIARGRDGLEGARREVEAAGGRALALPTDVASADQVEAAAAAVEEQLGPTVKAIVGNKLMPGLADWYLARTGYDAQQTDDPADPNRPHNLWEPVPGDHGAHGVFDDRATTGSTQLWARRPTGVGLLSPESAWRG
ncbi:MAG TPA: SDR family NAD(P)-dependent oxidoreductase [Candidatus Binatia bacterium]|nr:SDR family NAD(P)-dependent oxidoreductase [Candidatus Binatia bacterium]